MRNISWKLWLGVWLALSALIGGLVLLMRAQEAVLVANWLGFAGGLLINGWTLFGLYRWREVGWVRRLNTFVLVAIGFSVPLNLFQAMDWSTGLQSTMYLLLAVLGFMVGVNLLRLLLKPGYPILGVARTMIEEALRMRVAVVIIVLYLVTLSLLPTLLGSEDRVSYMVQRFLVYSSGLIIFLLGTLTVLLGAYSVSRDLSSRQLQMTLTKPLARWQYLLGKWLGIVLLNAVLVAVAGVAIYGFATAIADDDSLDDFEQYKVQREILTARTAYGPSPDGVTWEQMYTNVLEEKQLRDPEKFGEVGTPFSGLSDEAKQELLADTNGRFFTVESGPAGKRTYVFSGLKDAAEAAQRSIENGQAMLRDEAGLTEEEAEQYVDDIIGRPSELTREVYDKVTLEQRQALWKLMEREVIQLVLTPDITPTPENLQVEVQLLFNGQPWPRPPVIGMQPLPRRLTIETPNPIAVPAGMIDANGQLRVTIEVPERRSYDGFEQPFVAFNYKDAQIELFFRAASFESNLARAMVVVWLKLAFLAMLGLVAGALLSFPVAAMVGIIVFVAALVSGVIQESLDSYVTLGRGQGTWEVVTTAFQKLLDALSQGDIYMVFKMALRLIGEAFMLLIPSFGNYGTADALSNGRIIDNGVLMGAFLKIGLLWTGVIGLVGVYLFSRKELARVTV